MGLNGDERLWIGLASDHAGYELKEFIEWLLEKRDIPYTDYGTYLPDSNNYAIFGHKLAYAIEKGEVKRGIGICGTGNGINMTLNKYDSVRSALCWNEEITRLARAHNDINAMALPGRFISHELTEKMVDIFLKTPFDGGRHQERVDTINKKVEGDISDLKSVLLRNYRHCI
ncbi:MAG: RpiB/LacA/LacB family sugar-phosphate isomerase [Dysgonamonadaceae bacterium]|jgi:ribose 5-phosphate isomerase B|nr:RpiB/LacA/LacB family sugar-phosphate isomerase [Dysgonamonadaceae bacterium]